MQMLFPDPFDFWQKIALGEFVCRKFLYVVSAILVAAWLADHIIQWLK